MKAVLFIDRDGTLIEEPVEDQQVDSLEKLRFIPGVFTGLSRIAQHCSYELVLVSNQDGLGTASFPEEHFWPAHNKMLEALAGEGISFAAEHIDRSLPADNSPCRKPGTAMLTEYFSPNYELRNSFVIGDRISDVVLARNLGAKAIYFSETPLEDEHLADTLALQTTNWDTVYRFLRRQARRSQVQRSTAETKIFLELALDGNGIAEVYTGIGFFDHMLAQLARHSGADLSIKAQGDLEVDEHHTIEDTALVLGEAVRKALGDKRGIARYGFVLPMDESRASVALDFSGRPAFVWEADFKREKIGEMPCEMFPHFFKSFSDAAACTLHISATGDNEHHKIEAIFKAFAKCLGQAWMLAGEATQLPSTKEVL